MSNSSISDLYTRSEGVGGTVILPRERRAPLAFRKFVSRSDPLTVQGNVILPANPSMSMMPSMPSMPSNSSSSAGNALGLKGGRRLRRRSAKKSKKSRKSRKGRKSRKATRRRSA